MEHREARGGRSLEREFEFIRFVATLNILELRVTHGSGRVLAEHEGLGWVILR